MVMMGEGERITRGEAVELANQLTQVIEEGNAEKAKEIAATLASHRVKLLTEVIKPDKKEEPELSVRVYVEDKESSGASITLAVRPSDTVALLKKQVERRYNFPLAVQNWIIGLRMPRDTETLRQCGVRQPGHVMFLYLVSCRSVGLTKEAYLQQQQPPPAPCGAAEPRSVDAVDDHTRDSTYMSMDHHLRGVGRARPQSQGDVPAWEGRQPAVPPGPEAGPPSLPRRPPPQRNVTPAPQSLPQPARSAAVTTQPVGWACPKCTLINIPTRPGCAVCGESRPTDYRVPENVELPEEEQERLQRESQLDRQAKDASMTVPPGGGGQLDHMTLSPQDLDKLLRLNDTLQASASHHHPYDVSANSPEDNMAAPFLLENPPTHHQTRRDLSLANYGIAIPPPSPDNYMRFPVPESQATEHSESDDENASPGINNRFY